MENFVIHSSDNTVSITFSHYDKDTGSYQLLYQDLQATIKQVSWNTCGEVYNLYNLFFEINENWKGWSGKKEYIPLDNDFILSATTDSIGHIFLTIIFQKCDWKFETTIILDQTQIQQIAKNIKAFFKL